MKSSHLFATVVIAVGLFGGVPTAAFALTGAPPDGSNVGFRYSGSTVPELHAVAAFIQADGASLNTCSEGSGSVRCQFDFTYAIGGSDDQSAPYATSSAGVLPYPTWPTVDSTNVDDPFCILDAGGPGPLTNFNCFNENGFGQMFQPTRSGVLTNFSMAMTCLSPKGSVDLYANLYEVDEPGGRFPFALAGPPMASAMMHMSSCSTNWSGHSFSDTDFTYPVMDFGRPSLSRAKKYAVFFSGNVIAGAQPTGAPTTPPSSPETPAAPLAATGYDSLRPIGVGGAIVALGLGALALNRRKVRAKL